MILLTDATKPRHEGFAYAMPQGLDTWQRWRDAAARCESSVRGIAMAFRVGFTGHKDLVVLLPDESQSDEDAETAAAWLRVNEQYGGMIFVLRGLPAVSSKGMVLAALAEKDMVIEELSQDDDMRSTNGSAS
jgi:hypothetical protein